MHSSLFSAPQSWCTIGCLSVPADCGLLEARDSLCSPLPWLPGRWASAGRRSGFHVLECGMSPHGVGKKRFGGMGGKRGKLRKGRRPSLRGGTGCFSEKREDWPLMRVSHGSGAWGCVGCAPFLPIQGTHRELYLWQQRRAGSASPPERGEAPTPGPIRRFQNRFGHLHSSGPEKTAQETAAGGLEGEAGSADSQTPGRGSPRGGHVSSWCL